jgi:hypothetical protein
VIDLHLHTTASDGRLRPADLVWRAAAAGVTVLSVTDHDTLAGLAEARSASAAAGVDLIDGIEVTAVHDGRDVHVLGYFAAAPGEALDSFLEAQRANRVERVREMGARLASLGAAIDVDALLEDAVTRPDRAVGRPALARALVDAGHAASIADAFDRFLALGRPAFVPRTGHTPGEVVVVIQRAGGVASMAHPGATREPVVLASLVEEGIDAVEVYHPDHPPDAERELRALATARGLLMTGGSDFHGEDGRDRQPGCVALPQADLERLRDALTHRQARG